MGCAAFVGSGRVGASHIVEYDSQPMVARDRKYGLIAASGESMVRIRPAVFVVVCCFCFAARVWCEEPQKVTVCQIQKDPAAFNHKLIEVEGFVSSDFEDFTLFDPSCRSRPAIWLEYGGKSDSGTMFCCGTTPNGHHPQDLVVEGISIPLVENDAFKQFDKEVRAPYRSGNYGSVVHATFVGHFFAGTKQPFRHLDWGGYGHMGCCTLFAIQEILSVSPQDRSDLDYGASPDEPRWWWRLLTPMFPGNSVVEDQRQADLGPRAWAFNDPKRVASEAIRALAKIGGPEPLKLKATIRYPGRIDFEWHKKGTKSRYMVVVSRPYYLSFFAQDPKMVAWVVIVAYESPTVE